jgi:hypothetical protein
MISNTPRSLTKAVTGAVAKIMPPIIAAGTAPGEKRYITGHLSALLLKTTRARLPMSWAIIKTGIAS